MNIQNLSELDVTESEINLDEFSSIGSQLGGGRCSVCKTEGHNKRTCPTVVGVKPKKTAKKPRAKKRIVIKKLTIMI